MNESYEEAMRQRSGKFFDSFKKGKAWIGYLGLAVCLFIGAYIRTRNIPKLVNPNGGLSLAPDLDPYLFLRWAKEIVAGTYSGLDMMRFYPVGSVTSSELPFVHYGIAYLYKFLTLFMHTSIEYAAIIFPVIMFALSTIAFYLFVKKAFEDNEWNHFIALIATVLFSVIPGMLHRSIAGVPEKEAAAFFFMFMALYWLLCAWKSNTWKRYIPYGILAGLMTAGMALDWGGVIWLFMVPAIAMLLFFFSSKFRDYRIFFHMG